MKIKHFIFLLALIAFSQGCNKDEIGVTNTTIIDSGPTQTTESTVTGIITDDEGTPLADVSIQHRGDFLKSDENGYFKVSNAIAAEGGGLLKFNHEGYFKNYKWYYPLLNDVAFVRVIMVKEKSVGTINLSEGGSVYLNGGAKVIFPADAFDVSSGTSVEIFAHWYDPSNHRLAEEMPGDLRGIDQDEALVQLATYGMVAVEIRDATGNDIQLKEDVLATIEFPLPTDLQEFAPETIKTWSLDEDRAYWIEEGEAKLDGNKYIAQVNHFSFWNCDAPFPVIFFQGRIVNPEGKPIPNLRVCITTELFGNGTRAGWTSANGIFCGKIPKNEPLKLVVKDECGGVYYESEIGPFDSEADLGDLVVDTKSEIFIHGQLVCDGMPITTGYALMTLENGTQFVAEVDENGFYEMLINFCGANKISVKGYNLATNTVSEWEIFNNISEEVDAGVIEVCDGTSPDEFITFKLENDISELFDQNEFPYASLTNGELELGAENQIGNIVIRIDNPIIGTGNTANFIQANLRINQTFAYGFCEESGFDCSQVDIEFTSLDLTEGGYVEGNFMGIVQGELSPTNEIMGEFRIKIDRVTVTGVVSGMVWEDTNNDGIRDGSESSISPRSITVSAFSNGAFVATTTTNASGEYELNLPEGTYDLRFPTPSGYDYSPQDQGTDDTVDSDADPATGEINGIVISSGNTISSNNDVGMYFDGNIDCSEYNILQASTCGNPTGSFQLNFNLPDTFYIVKSSIGTDTFSVIDYYQWSRITEVPAGTITNSIFDMNGKLICTNELEMPDEEFSCTPYPFIECDNGVFYGGVELDCNSWTPNGMSFSWSNGSTSQSLDNILPGTYGLTVTDEYGCTAEMDVLFELPDAIIYGLVWVDNPLYKDNVYDRNLGEEVLAGVTVSLYESTDLTTPVSTVETTQNGYSFNGLVPGLSYVVGIEEPSGYDLVEKDDPGAPNEYFDSDVDQVTGLSDPILIEECFEFSLLIGLKPE